MTSQWPYINYERCHYYVDGIGGHTSTLLYSIASITLVTDVGVTFQVLFVAIPTHVVMVAVVVSYFDCHSKRGKVHPSDKKDKQ